ncbi:hypothetical protein PG984_003125 [Apiospora sp. TS-2023a]
MVDLLREPPGQVIAFQSNVPHVVERFSDLAKTVGILLEVSLLGGSSVAGSSVGGSFLDFFTSNEVEALEPAESDMSGDSSDEAYSDFVAMA